MQKIYPDFQIAIEAIIKSFINCSKPMEVKNWHAQKAPDVFREQLNVYFNVQMPNLPNLVERQILPNLEWANMHFEERVGGLAVNPPPSHEIWPYAEKGNKEHLKEEKFSHTYPERIWPKLAGNLDILQVFYKSRINHGIRYNYGDLSDVINLLVKDPTTRQAYLPIWFPEDTGAVENQRVPCTIGYHFIIRDGYLHMTYWIRSCDLMRHFRDDIYLAWKLADHIRNSLYRQGEVTTLGIFTMHIVNLHCFNNEFPILSKSKGL